MQMYADDMVVVCRNLNELTRAQTFLEKWCDESGMVINLNKSKVIIMYGRGEKRK